MQRCKGAKVQRCKGSKGQRFKGAKGKRCKGAKVQRWKGDKLTAEKIRGQANTQTCKQTSGVTSSLLELLVAAKKIKLMSI